MSQIDQYIASLVVILMDACGWVEKKMCQPYLLFL